MKQLFFFMALALPIFSRASHQNKVSQPFDVIKNDVLFEQFFKEYYPHCFSDHSGGEDSGGGDDVLKDVAELSSDRTGHADPTRTETSNDSYTSFWNLNQKKGLAVVSYSLYEDLMDHYELPNPSDVLTLVDCLEHEDIPGPVVDMFLSVILAKMTLAKATGRPTDALQLQELYNFFLYKKNQ